MKLTDALLGEHGIFYYLFNNLVEMCENEKGPPLQELQGALKLAGTALLSHAKIEEDVLFSALEPVMGPMGPLSVMRAEHQKPVFGMCVNFYSALEVCPENCSYFEKKQLGFLLLQKQVK